MSLHVRAIAVHVCTYLYSQTISFSFDLHSPSLNLSLSVPKGIEHSLPHCVCHILRRRRRKIVYVSVPGRAYKLPTCECARAYSVQDNIINFDCDHVLFSIRNQLLRTRITFLRGVRRRCMHRINVTTIITECVLAAIAAFDVHSLLNLFTQILKFLCVHFGFLNDRLCSRSHLICSSNLL